MGPARRRPCEIDGAAGSDERSAAVADVARQGGVARAGLAGARTGAASPSLAPEG